MSDLGNAFDWNGAAWCDEHRPDKASTEPSAIHIDAHEARGTLPSMDANINARPWVGIDLAKGPDCTTKSVVKLKRDGGVEVVRQEVIERLPAEVRTYNLADYDAAREAAGCRDGESLAEKVRRLVVNEKCARMDVATAMAMVDQLEAKARDLERALSDDRRALFGRRYTQPIGVDRDEDE